ncbi:MAG: hypothetical protein QOJ29_5350 [Thermoleophilaceae bacterium]|nr:hypothetical protein [Thermoleophilaceae bacterium]
MLFRAFTYHYQAANRWRLVRNLGTLGLALVAPVVSIYSPGAGGLLGAVAGGWILVARTILARLEAKNRRRASLIQEEFDVGLFGLPWNEGLVGKRVAPEDIADAAEHVAEGALDWYPDADRLPWPSNVLVCQRGNAVWGRRNHDSYSQLLLAAGGAWFVVGVVIAAGRELSLATYLATLFLPSQPAFLDAIEFAQGHGRQSSAKAEIESAADDVLNSSGAGAGITVSDCRLIQDQTFRLRSRGPSVPNWFYRLRRDRDQRALDAGVETIGRQLGP